MKNRAMTLTLSGLAGLSLWTTVALAQGADSGIPLVCRPPEAGETPNAYIPTSQSSGAAVQSRTQQVRQPANVLASPSATVLTGRASNPTVSQSTNSTNLPASPVPSVPATNVRSAQNASPRGQTAQTVLAPLEREVQTGSNYRVCPPPTMPSEVPSTQLYAVPYAVAAAWECYGPREMAYTPRPWRGPDPAVHSPLPITPTRAARAPSSKAKVAVSSAAKPEGKTSSASGATGATGATGAVASPGTAGQMPVPMLGTPAKATQSLVNQTPATNGNMGNSAPNGESHAQPVVSGGSVAAPIIVPSAPRAGENGQQASGQAVQNPSAQNPYSGAASDISPSRDIVDSGENGTRTAQAPVSLLNAPPLTPNPTPTPNGFNPR